MARVDVQGANAGYVDIPAGGSGVGDASDPPVGHWYSNAQQPEGDVVTMPSSEVFNFAYLPPLMRANRRVVLLSHFCVDVKNVSSRSIDVKAQIGVSEPSEYEYPMRPYVGVMHSVSSATILAGASASLTVIRLDAIDPDLLSTPIPWQVVGSPKLCPQVFGPAGTQISNCAMMVSLGG